VGILSEFFIFKNCVVVDGCWYYRSLLRVHGEHLGKIHLSGDVLVHSLRLDALLIIHSGNAALGLLKMKLQSKRASKFKKGDNT
jgi:hypothetical protein